jgi:hypothetical protein
MSNSDIEAKIEALPPNEDLKFLNRVSGYYKKSDLTTDDLKTLVSQLREARQERFQSVRFHSPKYSARCSPESR